MQKVACDLIFFESHVAWPEVLKICKNLNQNGFEAFLAGGCVRDLVMARQPKDFDIATNATPDQIVELYPQALSVGREFGVIILAYEKFQIEIATFRKDGPYLDGRRPSSIRFTTAEEDSKRRDFTINAIFLDIKESLIIDYVSGLEDIKSQCIRAVGDPFLRFSEDKLRMLRALRFSSQLEFQIEEETMRAIQKEHACITQVSGERIKDELTKWLESSNLEPCLTGLWATGLLKSLHPTFQKQFSEKNYLVLRSHFSEDLSKLRIDSKFCLLFSFIIQKNQTDEFDTLKNTLKDLKFSGEQTSVISWTLTNYFKLLGFENLRLSDQIELCAHLHFSNLEQFTQIIHPELSKKLWPLISNLRRQFLPNGALPRAFLDGEILKSLGAKPGRAMGELLKEIYRLQMEHQLTSKEQALEYAKNSLDS